MALATPLSSCAAGVDTSTSEAFEGHAIAPVGQGLESFPSDDQIPTELGKEDVAIPERFDLLQNESPIRSQGQKGLCMGFAITSIVESMYRSEGLLPDPDFSEQYVAWLGQGQKYSSTTSEAVDGAYTLDRWQEFGVPLENVWPYNGRNWNQRDHRKCESDELDQLPGLCHSNGKIPHTALEAPMFHIGGWRYLRHTVDDIKAYMAAHHAPVAIGLFVSWPIWSPQERAEFGYISLPTNPDKASVDGAHGVAIVGWDDSLEIPRADGIGGYERTASGDPIYDRGVFIMRNSWGTSWAPQNPAGAGYGYVSYRYYRRFGTQGIVVTPPRASPAYEQCLNGLDDDEDGATDCDDPECQGLLSCVPRDSLSASSDTEWRFSAHSPVGAFAWLWTPEPGLTSAATQVHVTLTINHPDSSELEIVVTDPQDIEHVVFSHERGHSGRFTLEISTDAFAGSPPEGRWTVAVRNPRGSHAGTLERTSIRIERTSN